MGQYYKACLLNENRVRVITPDWMKIMEHSWYGNTTMRRVEKLLFNNPMSVMWVWDYSQCAPFCWTYKWVWEENWFKVDYNEIEDLLDREEWKNYFLVNHTRKCYINMTKQENTEEFKSDWRCVHPLSLLTRCDTEEAWWDYHSDINKDKLWIWCWDEIEVVESDSDTLDWYTDRTNDLYFKE